MSLVSLLQKQVEHRAQLLCHHRNLNLPVELGKASYEPLENGVNFIKQHYLLDSTHSHYMSYVARVVWSEKESAWLLYMADEGQEWMPYPYLAKAGDLTAIMREVEKDPKAIFWY